MDKELTWEQEQDIADYNAYLREMEWKKYNNRLYEMASLAYEQQQELQAIMQEDGDNDLT